MRHNRLPLAGLALLFMGFGSDPALAQGRSVSSAVDLARAAETLAPGEWVWAPQIAPAGPILIYVNLADQHATVYRNGVRIGVTTISSGRSGHETPTGVFSILQKDADHRSSKYNNAPMFYMERLTWDGIALHAGGLPGYPESHGCVHLPLEFARLLYGVTDHSVTVVVAGDAARHVGAVPAGVTAPFAADGHPVHASLMGASWRWTPEVSPDGPITIVLSKEDQTALVLRNGIEIGRSPIELADHDEQVHVLTLTHGADGEPHWIYAAVPGREAEAGAEPSPTVIGRLRAPQAFYDTVKASLRPGDTILVTPAPIGQGSTGQPLTVMDGFSDAAGG
ncbi:L,D-transpeptidase family protein [Brevundimonas sp.]|uniref:L,D-transpeptidase family protein n=1 Tax=Brevundimonas sp. TaxID=1871086 RepID=UPI0035B405DA